MTGMRKIARNVAASIPPITVVPITRRETAPEPRPPVPAQDGKEQDKPKEPAQTIAASKLEQPAAGDEKRPGFFRRLFTFDY